MAEAPITVALLTGHASRRGEVRRLARLVDRLASRGILVRILCSGGALLLRDQGVEAQDEPWIEQPWLSRVAVRRLPMADPDFRAELVHALHDEAAEVASALALHRNLPLIRTLEDDLPDDSSPRLDARSLDAVVVFHQAIAELLADRDRGIGGRIHVIPPGFEPPPGPGPDQELISPDRVPVIGSMGRLGSNSGFETFLDAIHRVVDLGRDVEFLVAGLGPGEPRVRRRAERLGIADRLTFAGPSALEEAFWRVVDVYDQPASSPSCGRFLMAALAAGRPCVAADVDGPRQLLDSGARGLLVPPGDPVALSRAMLSLLDQPLLARSLADRGRSWACSHLDPDLEADALAALYQQVARPSSGPTTLRS